MNKLFFLLFLLMVSLTSFGQSRTNLSTALKESAEKVPSYVEGPSDADGIFTVWPDDGVPSGSESWTWHEQSKEVSGDIMARNVVIPTITMFKPEEGTANGTSVIVLPGGAFHFLMMENEGYEVARSLAKSGVTAFVLKYRVQPTPVNEDEFSKFMGELSTELPRVDQYEAYPPVGHFKCEEARLWGEEDGKEAISFLRQNASDLGIDPNKIGIMGFSAGGGISVNIALQCDSLSRPNFVGGIYPGYRVASPPANKDVAPLFLAIADDDSSVAPISSARLYEQWHKLSQSVELHVFSSGKHGFGMKNQNFTSDAWIGLFKNWLDSLGFLSSPSK